MAEQYIYTIENLTKAYGKREVLKNIYLAFYPGAKIGVIGSNGAGKSTLLRVMAGVERDFHGTARLTPNFSVGWVPQEPRLDESTDVRGNIEKAVAGTRALLTQQEELGNKMAEASADDIDDIMEEMSKVQDAIDAANAYDLDRQLEIAMDAMRLPPGDAKPSTLSGGERRRVGLCKTLLQQPDLLLLDEPTNHLDAESVDWLERTLARIRRHRRRRHPRPLLPRQRGRMDPGAGPRQSASPGRATTRRGWSRSRRGWPRRRNRSRQGARRWPASWSGPRWRRGRGSPRARRV